jgi:hypothetical protein
VPAPINLTHQQAEIEGRGVAIARACHDEVTPERETATSQ